MGLDKWTIQHIGKHGKPSSEYDGLEVDPHKKKGKLKLATRRRTKIAPSIT